MLAATQRVPPDLLPSLTAQLPDLDQVTPALQQRGGEGRLTRGWRGQGGIAVKHLLTVLPPPSPLRPAPSLSSPSRPLP